MNYTKIGKPNEPWNSIITEDLEVTTSRNPVFIFADRFKVYQLRIINPDNLHERKVAWYVEGDKKKKETLLCLIYIDLNYNSVDRISIQKSLAFDSQQAYYFKMHFLIWLYRLETYYIPAKILKVERKIVKSK